MGINYLDFPKILKVKVLFIPATIVSADQPPAPRTSAPLEATVPRVPQPRHPVQLVPIATLQVSVTPPLVHHVTLDVIVMIQVCHNITSKGECKRLLTASLFNST